MYDKIKNPVTGRFVKTDSRLGQNIINGYLEMVGGAKNPHTGNEWSSYNCNYDSEDDCEDQDGTIRYENGKPVSYPRCKWVKTAKRQYCRKAQSSSRKRGQKSWGKLKSKVSERSGVDPSNQLADHEVLGLLENYEDLSDSEYRDLYNELSNYRYNPNYKSAFGRGESMSKFDYNNPEDAVWHQASDRLAAHLKYGDEF
jgi:hypothetical protein